MLTEKDLIISGKSYINKDFASIYPEQVDIFKTLTNRYDPETSNESDPGIVMMKTNAFIADKLCYNIDKNVLENFMPSATQESSMSDLCARLGYEMKYYIASATDIYIKYTGKAFNSPSDGGYENANYFKIPKFTTITSSDGENVFVTIVEREYKNRDEFVTIPAIQGNVHTLSVADSEVIKLENLTTQNRIYFNESLVAQNGIFITSVDNVKEEWRLSSNLNLELPNTKCYKFGYDSVKRWPYIEFPTDIASLIGSGLNIKYVVTDGENGNVKANTLTNITSATSFDILTEQGENVTNEEGNVVVTISDDSSSELIIKNTSASIGGANPETIDEAYTNFKRTIGTFDTLVTCRDYANAIYNLYDEDNVYPVVSNVQVSDRRDDINYSNKILTLDEYGTKYIYGNNDINAFDLCVYPLKPITSYTDKNYIESFKPKTNLTYIQDSLENGKTISHDYKELHNNDVFAIKNKYRLDVKLTTTYKVTQYERVTIIANVLNALIKNFNAREVDYGEEIPYETILNTIQNADERINYVSLAEPAQTTYFMTKDGTETSLNETTNDVRDEYLNVLARNILAGKVSLFNLYDMFNFEFGESDGEVRKDLKSIDSEAIINLPSDYEYTLQNNEVIQIIGPSFVTTVPYGYGIRYHYDGQTISKDTEYELMAGESLTVRYKKQSSDALYTVITYPEGTIIKPTFDLVDTDDVAGAVVGDDGIKYAMIQSDQEIDIRKLNASILDGFTYCYWLRNTENNALFTSADLVTPLESGSDEYYETMLQDGEYFFYKTSLKSDFIALGSGTILKTTKNLGDQTAIWSISDIVSMNDILEKGSGALDGKWKNIIFSVNGSLEIQETNILTLTAQDKIKITGSASGYSGVEISNSLQELDNDVEVIYTFADGTMNKLESINYENYKWKIKSRLDINAGPNNAQIVDSSDEHSEHHIRFQFKDGSYLPSASHYYGESGYKDFSFKLNEKQQFVGGNSIVASAIDIATGDYIYPLSVYVFKNNESVSVDSFRNDLGFVNVSVKNTEFRYVDSGDIFTSVLKIPLSANKCVLTVYYQKIDSGNTYPTLTVSDGDSGSGLRQYNHNTTDSYSSSYTFKEGINVIDVSDGVYELTFASASGIDGILSIGKLTYLDTDEFNDVFKLLPGDDEKNKLLEKLRTIDTNGKFYYNSEITKDNLIDVDDLSTPTAFYDYNNIANKFTISQIDIVNSNIDVVKTSLLG